MPHESTPHGRGGTINSAVMGRWSEPTSGPTFDCTNRQSTLAKIRRIVEAMPGARVVTSEPDYLYAQFTTPLMKFVDDTEFWFDPASSVVQLRSASRVGHGDRGLNRARVEVIRAQLATPP